MTNAKMCDGSYGDGVQNTYRFPADGVRKGRVTAQCPVCGRRVALVTLYADANKGRGLGRHDAPAASQQ